MSSGDAYLRTGRGGAGNFYSPKDVEDAAKQDKTEDIEAQKVPAQQDGNSTTPNNLQSSSASTAGADGATYMRSGRGGAGNFVTPDLPTTTPTPTTTSSPPSSSAPKPASSAPRYSGRGGAGNYDSGESEAARRAKEEQEVRRKEALDAGIAQEIRASLAAPPRTYHLHQPGRGRKPEDDVADA
ncbi:hypothetical protein F5B22DRAFT_583480 [Xylaria bambusicola]|uniref:uncharacterized protein n=1 Tax=Xylaria bambusicola TaxID=326684 RepID=UPI0020083F28|nr:uncharacterized protein F5B22DRAFT_583480 [Xylaria bambusicola]KAI0528072.1 hypothetical protein F5B22DRAFT_583480 [Xylaria bambusicola]